MNQGWVKPYNPFLLITQGTRPGTLHPYPSKMTWFEVRITPDGCLAEVSPQFEEKRPAKSKKRTLFNKTWRRKETKTENQKKPKTFVYSMSVLSCALVCWWAPLELVDIDIQLCDIRNLNFVRLSRLPLWAWIIYWARWSPLLHDFSTNSSHNSW